jgi:hypothetical protein
MGVVILCCHPNEAESGKLEDHDLYQSGKKVRPYLKKRGKGDEVWL